MVYEHRRAEIMDRFRDDRKAAAGELAALDGWLNDPERQSDVLRSFVPILSRQINPFAAKISEGYRSLRGDRSLIVLPMGGAIPGPIPYMAARQRLLDDGWDPQDWDEVIETWEYLDGVTAEYEIEISKKGPKIPEEN